MVGRIAGISRGVPCKGITYDLRTRNQRTGGFSPICLAARTGKAVSEPPPANPSSAMASKISPACSMRNFFPKPPNARRLTRTKTKTRMKTAMTSTTTKMRTKKKKTKSMRTSTRMKRMMATKKRMTTRTRKKRTTTSTTPTMMTTTTITKTRNSKTTMNRTAYDNRSCTISSNSKRMVSSSWWMESWWKSRRVHWQARRLVSFQQHGVHSNATNAGDVFPEQSFRCFSHDPAKIRRPDVAFVVTARA